MAALHVIPTLARRRRDTAARIEYDSIPERSALTQIV